MNASRSKSIVHFSIVFALLASLLGSAIGVTPAYAAMLTVTNTNDSGAGSLRQAIADAAPNDGITFDASLMGATIHLASTLTLSQDVTIDGSALVVPITISGDSDGDGDGDVPIFIVDTGVTVTLDSLVLAKGNAGTEANNIGGAIVSSGTLTINNSSLIDNYAKDGGGAVYNYTGNTLTISNSTFSNNASSQGGGAILNVGTLNISNSTFSYNYTNGGIGGGAIVSAGTTTVTNSTFTHNTASTVDGAGIFVITGTTTVTGSTFDHNSAAGGASMASLVNTTLNVTNSTFADNTATGISGGIYNNGTLNLTNSTFSGNSAGVADGVFNGNIMNFANNIIANSSFNDCYNIGTIGTHVNNLVEIGNCPSDVSSDPRLDILADNGGPTQTIAPLPGSPAIDAGDNAICAGAPVSNVDQRGVTRPFGPQCDRGAVEYTTTYVVTKAADTNDGTCDTDCSLREAINAANLDASGDTIMFDGDYTIALNSALPSPTDDLTIDGKGHTIIIDGNHASSILDATASLHLKNLTIQNGTLANGGAITIRYPSTITNVTFANNTATSNGGAIYNYLSTLSITNSTFTGNSAGGGGGAIKNDNGTLTVSNSTFSGNSASVGGAIIALGASITTVRNSTFSGNSAGTAAGIYSNGTLNYANTIIANSTGNDCTSDGTLGINLNNLVEDGSCSASLSGDPKLGALANNGGSTQTFALLAGSAAINAGNDTVCLLAPVNDLDQRGTIRPNGPQCDIGAYEYVDITAPTVSSFTATTHSNSLSIPITAFTATDALDVTGYMITQSSTPPSAGAAGWSASAPTTYIVASEGSYTLYPWAKDAAGNVSSVSGSPDTVSVDTTVPTVTSFTATTPATSLAIPITAFTATDAIGVAGYIITQSPTPPSAGAAGWSTSAPTSYSVGNDGTYTLYPWAKDAAGNVSSVFASPASVSVDTSAPTVVSSVRSNHNPTTAASVEFLVTFSEAVTGVDAADLNLTMTGSVSGALISSVSGAGRTYTVTVSTGSGAGTLRLDVTDNDSIADTASNRLGGTGAGNGAFTNGEAYTKEQYRIYLALVRR